MCRRPLVQRVDGQAGTEFRLEPGRLGRHDVAGVGDVDELLHRDGIEREGDGQQRHRE